MTDIDKQIEDLPDEIPEGRGGERLLLKGMRYKALESRARCVLAGNYEEAADLRDEAIALTKAIKALESKQTELASGHCGKRRDKRSWLESDVQDIRYDVQAMTQNLYEINSHSWWTLLLTGWCFVVLLAILVVLLAGG